MSKRNALQRLLRIEPGVALAQWAYDTAAAVGPRLAALFIAGGGMTYLSAITDWTAKLGPVGIGAIGLSAALGTNLVLALAQAQRAKARERNAIATSTKDWIEHADNINPLEDQFTKKRIRLSDLANPITNRVKRKRLIDCELMGPGVMVIQSTPGRGSSINHVSFFNCDVIVLKDIAAINNVIVLEDLTMLGGAIYSMTIYISRGEVAIFQQMGANFVTLTGTPEAGIAPVADTTSA
ncbi:hypothetical protein NKI54_06110 [Mesorhizobium sp. M0663]|uniref:hypothetical protein n=1 Tax=Mesorhizobium sp. M0663 TaxID=2956981 RepID=UPI00333C8FDB